MNISRILLITFPITFSFLYLCVRLIAYNNKHFLSSDSYLNLSVTYPHASSWSESFICNYNMKYLQYPWIQNRLHPGKNLQVYCSKTPNPTSGWVKAKRYQESDVAFIICTAASLYKTRARSVRDTWTSRITHFYFLGSEPDPTLPITIIKNTGEDYQSNTKKIFHGLKLIYRKQLQLHSSVRHKWYVIVGCDTYVNVPHLLKQLEPFPHTQPYFIGGSVGEGLCYHKNGTAYKSLFVGGNTAHIFSSELMERLYPHLSYYVESIWPQPNHTSAAMSDVALSCLIFNLKFNMTIVPGLWRRSPDGIIEEFGLKESLKVKEPSSWHYIHPAQMIDLDEFYSYQHVDRLKNDRNWNELIGFIQLFIGAHYETLRKYHSSSTRSLVRKYK